MTKRHVHRAGPALAGALVWLVSAASADVVHLKNGNRVEGDVGPGSQPGSIRVTLDRGLEVEFPQSEVQEVVQKKSPARELEERLRSAPEGDVDALLQLAEWARERKLRSGEEKVYRRILEIDPNDPVARRELGFVVFRNRWVREAELKGKHGLVQFRGDWVTPEEKERRIREELEKEIEELFRGVDSDNRYIREYSVRKLMEYRDPRARGVALRSLGDGREAVRVVAVQMLAVLHVGRGPAASGKKGQAGDAGKAARSGAGTRNGGGAEAARRGQGKASSGTPPPALEEEIARALLDRALIEESPTVRTALSDALQKMRPRRFFELALETLAVSADPLKRDRAAEGVFFALEKGWVDELIRALPRRPPGLDPAVGGNPAVRSVLVQLARQDFEYRVPDWQAWWASSQARFQTEG